MTDVSIVPGETQLLLLGRAKQRNIIEVHNKAGSVQTHQTPEKCCDLSINGMIKEYGWFEISQQ